MVRVASSTTPDGDRRPELTPFLVAQGVVSDGPGGITANGSSGRLTVHSRSDPCGHLPDDHFPSFVEWLEDWLQESVATVEPCRVCGGNL